MTGNNPVQAVDGIERWEHLEIDAGTCQLAETAAKAAGLTLDEWLERAIRRACPSTNIVAAPPPLLPAPQIVPSSPTLASETQADSSVVEADADVAADTILAEAEADSIPPIADQNTADETLRPGAPRQLSRRWSFVVVGAVLAAAAGVVSAQYLLPDPGSAIHVALAPTPGDSGTAIAGGKPAAAPTPPPETRLNEYTPATAGEAPGTRTPVPPPAATTTPSEPPAAIASVPSAPDAAGSSAAPAPTGPATAPPKTVFAKPAPPPAASGKKPAAKGDEPPSDPQQLAPWLEARVKSGDAVAQYRLGVLYALGDGVTQDYQRAATLFKAAADEGVTEAEYNIAVMYAEGLGIGRDPNRAVFWYRKAAAQGSASAAFNLGVAYSNGIGVTQSMDQAAEWFRRAAQAGVVNAQFNIGLLYERGDGVPASQTEAYAWYSIAAAHGDSGAAQRRDRLASTLAPAVLKEAQTRAEQVQVTIPSTGATAPNIGAARKP